MVRAYPVPPRRAPTFAVALSDDGRSLAGHDAGPDGVISGWVATLPSDLHADGDGIPAATDVCPHAFDPAQRDTHGVGANAPPDGIGDACQCGDVNGDGGVTLADAALIQRAALVPSAASPAKPGLCDVNGDGRCSVADAALVRRALLVPPLATIEPRCAPARP